MTSTLTKPTRPINQIHFFQDDTYLKIRSQDRWNTEIYQWDKHLDLHWHALFLHRKLRIFPGIISMIMFGPNINFEKLDLASSFIKDLIRFSKNRGSLYLSIQPYLFYTPSLSNFFNNLGFKQKNEQILYTHTCMIDLSSTEDEILSTFDGNIRTALRKAEKSNIEIRINEGPGCVNIFYELYREAYQRGGGAFQTKTYFQRVWDHLGLKNEALFGIAYVDGKPITGLLNVFLNGNMIYLSGGSIFDEERLKHRPNEKLHWEMIRLAKNWGCKYYDLGGVNPDPAPSTKSAGIAHFKRQFARDVKPLLGYFRYTHKPHVVRGIDWILPIATKLKRHFGRNDVTDYNLM